ncbi:hypothetical protein BGZ60DRAFT_426268 [Tricladium varicosporioides]|nr:hypothetical protein BGZ60DRAFT_426268 [Hymenoscyphus varicosporioides]
MSPIRPSTLQWQNAANTEVSAVPQIGQKIYAFIVEIKIEQATKAEEPPHAVPVIALCDPESSVNWASQKLVEYLSIYGEEYRKRPHRGQTEKSHIRIHWSCGRLGLHSQQDRFCIKPDAGFKIMFGCAYSTRPASRQSLSRIRLQNRQSSASQRQTETRLSDEVIQRFHRGMEDGTLLRLKRNLPYVSDEGSARTIEELEAELEYVFDSFVQTDRVLDSTEEVPPHYTHSSVDNMPRSPQTITSSSQIPRASVPIPSSSGDSILDFSEHFSTLSSATSVSDFPYSRKRASYSLAETIEGDKLTQSHNPYSLYSIADWIDQPPNEDPWVLRTITQEHTPEPEVQSLGIRRCTELGDEKRQILDRARAIAEKEAGAYWIWDEEVQQYKHYDEGCADPVWYNPS